MLTLFSVPKPSLGHAGTIQANAVRSWTLLAPDVQVILFGDEEGVGGLASELRVEHLPDVRRSPHGTPLLDGVFAEAERHAHHPMLAFVNADIVLLQDFVPALSRVASEERPFLVIGESWDTHVDERLDFAPGWSDALARRPGRKRGAGAIDYFAFTPGLFAGMPPFAVGRIAFDNWLVWHARQAGALVVDATSCVHAVHQSHDYGHVAGGFSATRYFGEEGQRNLALAGGKRHLYTRFDATHILTRRGLRRNLGSVLRSRERCRKAIYKLRRHTPWPVA